MKSQLQNNNLRKNSKEIPYEQEYFSYLNSLLISIKKFYKVVKNIANNQNYLINGAEEKLNIHQSFLDKILKKEINFNEMNSINIFIKNLKDFFNKIKTNISLEEKNISFFFDDVKLLFTKIKGKYLEIKNEKRQRSIETTNNELLKKKYINYSDFNTNIKDIYNFTLQNNSSPNRKLVNKELSYSFRHEKNNRSQKNVKYNLLLKNKINEERCHNNENDLTFKNRNVSNELNSFTYNLENSTNDYNNKNKDKLILSLKEERKIANKKINELIKNLNNCKKEIEKLNKEIISLKHSDLSIRNYSNSKNNNKSQKNQLKIKINGLIKENNILEQNILKIKPKSLKTFYNTNNKLNNKNTKNIILEQNNFALSNSNENDLLQNNLIFIEKNNNLDKKKNINELNNENIILKNKYNSVILELTNKNFALQENLKKEQNVLLNLKIENINKNNELESLKKIVNNSKNKKNQNKLEMKNLKKIIEYYKKENEEIKKINNNLKIQTEYYQSEIKKKETELKYHNININRELKDNYEKKIKELTEFNNYLNEQIADNDVKILELKFQVEQMKEIIKNKDEKINKLLKNKMIYNDISNDHKKEISTKKIENYSTINNNLNKEISNLKRDNELLKNKIIIEEKYLTDKKKPTKNIDIDILNDRFNTIQNEHINIKTNNKKFKKIKLNFDNNNINDINNKTIKNKNEEIEPLKKNISALQKEKQKKDDAIYLLKNENQMLKNKLIQFSSNILNKYNDLKNQYIDLKNKYNLLTQKNNVDKLILEKNNSNNFDNYITIEKKLSNELEKAKNKIDLIKKENKGLDEKLEKKEIKKEINGFNNKSEEFDIKSFEEEYNLRKIGYCSKEKMYSQDINIDYPGIQEIKEKNRKLNFHFKCLENLVKELLLKIHINQKNKELVTELCKVVKFDSETTNKILSNNF